MKDSSTSSDTDSLMREAIVQTLAERAIAVLASSQEPSQTPMSQWARTLSDRILSDDPDDYKGYLDRLINHGLDVDEAIDILIPATARLLGERWFADEISFADVTIGSAVLQRSIRHLRAQDPRPVTPEHNSPRILLIVPSSEDHSLGLFVAVDQLRRLGLVVEVSVHERRAGLLERLRASPFKMIGITASGARTVAAIKELVPLIRNHSRGYVPIAVGGPIAQPDSDVKDVLPVDATCADMKDAAVRFRLLSGNRIAAKGMENQRR